MRILHTADWHLGRGLCGQSFHSEQDWLFAGAFMERVREVRPDLIIIAGDIYDRSVPPGDSVELLGEILHSVVRGQGIPVALIAGNHDDQRRLAFAAPLLREVGLHIADSPVGTTWRFADEHGPVSVLAADYGSPALVATLLGDAALVDDHETAFAGVMRNLRGQLPPGDRSVVVAHAFVQGGESSDSERLLQVGGSGAVSAAHLAGFDYVALGHLHRPQQFEGGRIRYAGSPLAYSFSEAGQPKSMTLVELDAVGGVRLHTVDLPTRSALRVMRGTFDEVLAKVSDHPNDWLQIVLTDRPFDAMARLRERHKMVLDLRFETPTFSGVGPMSQRDAARDPLDALAAFWQAVRGEALPDAARPELLGAIQAAIDEAG